MKNCVSPACFQELMKISPSISQPTSTLVIFVFICCFLQLAIWPTDSMDLFQQSSNSLHFSNASFKMCYDISFNFDMDDICEHFANCSTIKLESSLTKVEETARAYIEKGTASLVIVLPERCRCNTPTLNNSRITKTVTISSIVVVLSIVAVVVFILLFYRKGKR